jgi:hypothetical protein
MEQALEPTAYIYEGVWRNLSKSTARNLTLTLCPTRAVILTNALALFVAMSGSQLWTIIRFTLHQIRSTSQPQNRSKTHNQQQVVLRNATTDIATARLMFYIAWSSRRNARDAIAACMTILILAGLNAIFFMVAGTFSNSLVNAGTVVLSRSPHCGYWNETYFGIAANGNNPTTAETFALSTEYINKAVNDIQLNVEYARTCYESQSSIYWDSTCNTLPVSRLNWTTSTDAACPFDAKACSRNANTISFDTGLIDSHKHLGINAMSSDRLKYRRLTQCTVLNDTIYTTDLVNQTDNAGRTSPAQRAYANYGPSSLMGTDFTYSYSNFGDFYTNFTGEGTTPYQIGTTFAYGPISDVDNESYSTFTPIPEIAVTNADLLLLFLGYTGKFTEPINDPWFSAHVHENHDSSFDILQNLYTPDKPISTLACTEQHQICTSFECSGLLGYDQVQEDIAARIHINPRQNVTLVRMLRAMTDASLFNIVMNIAKTTTPVVAINQTAVASFTVSLPLPDDQWQLELQRWHAVAMATLQRDIVEYGTGQVAARTKYFVPPQTASESWICQNQRIKSTVYQSFNLISLIVIVIFGTLIILVSLRVEYIVGWWQVQWGRGGRGRQMWDDHDMLGRQRWRRAFDTPVVSRQFFSPHFPVSSPARTMELGYLQTRFSGTGARSMTGHSPKRASSQALSPDDEIRTFGSSGDKSTKRNSPSTLRSAITADFCFDFGPQRNSPSPPCTGYPVEKAVEEKPLPRVPMQEKAFVIDRGAEPYSTPQHSYGNVPAAVSVPTKPAIGSGPGRWAYYSAHKRRYGPRLAAPAPHLLSPNSRSLRGDIESRQEGNWI